MFDFYHNVETRKIIKNEYDNAIKSSFKDNATYYAPLRIDWIQALFKYISALGYKPEVFTDIGCGKGKACFFAAKTKKFNRIIGIDFNSTLVEIANKNLKKAKYLENKNKINFSCSDASNYILEDGQNLIFMFNPFDSVVMSIFLKNNYNKIKQYDSIIAYVNDREQLTLINSGFVKIWSDPSNANNSLWKIK
jgi:ubiquinone/menaquinone biosynthesis C-methylase UbiE